MPKSTFFNLDPDKRRRIVDAAIEEFSARSFHRASLSRLVQRVGIAKGSVYQYFDDKLDLYRWLLTEEVPRRKAAHLQAQVVAAPPTDLRGFLRQAVMSGVRFMLDNPRLSQLATAVTMPTDDPQLAAVYREVLAGGHEAFTQLLRGMVSAGSMRDDVDPHLAARVIAAVLGSGLREIVMGQLGVDMTTLFGDPSFRNRISDDALDDVVNAVAGIVVDGLGPKETA